MHKNLSRFAGCLCALGFAGLCAAGEAVRELGGFQLTLDPSPVGNGETLAILDA